MTNKKVRLKKEKQKQAIRPAEGSWRRCVVLHQQGQGCSQDFRVRRRPRLTWLPLPAMREAKEWALLQPQDSQWVV